MNRLLLLLITIGLIFIPSATDDTIGSKTRGGEEAVKRSNMQNTRVIQITTTLWRLPLRNKMTLLQPFIKPPTPYASGHRGIDVAAVSGDIVLAPVQGTVSFVGTVVDRPVLSITVDHQTVLSLEPVSSELQAGDNIDASDVIGIVGTGAHCNERCLHIGVRVNDEYVNPLKFFASRAVLLQLRD